VPTSYTSRKTLKQAAELARSLTDEVSCLGYDAERLAVKAEIEAENAETTAEESPGTASSGRDPHSPEGENAHP